MRLLLLVLLTCSPFVIFSQSAKPEQLIDNPLLNNASVSTCIIDAETGERVLCSKPQLSLVPASTLKAITSATALELFGPDHTFDTQLFIQGQIDKTSKTLHGDIIIKGGGDPTLGSAYFEEHYSGFISQWIDAVKQLEVETIDGAILYDAAIFDDELVPPTWIWEDLGNYYGAGASGLSVFDNMYKIHFSTPSQPNMATTITKVEPHIYNLNLINRVVSSDSSSDQAYIFGSPRNHNRVIRGTLPKNRNDYIIKGSIPNPPLFLARYLTEQLRKNGIEVINEAAEYQNSTGQKILLCKTTSPPLFQIIKELNFESINMYAEHLTKHIGLKINNNGSTKSGTKAIVKFWEKKGIDTSGMFLEDGSGLSHFNAITAEQLTSILFYMKNQSSYGKQFFETLPLAGRQGTLKYYFRHNNYPGIIRAKSGSMTRVRCLTGIYQKGATEYLFTVMANNYQGSSSQVVKLMEELIVTL